MKKLLLALALIATPAMANVRFENDVHIGPNNSRQQAEAAVDLVRAFGYRCDIVNTFRNSLGGGSFVLHCNNYRYKYTIKDVGGRWRVTVD